DDVIDPAVGRPGKTAARRARDGGVLPAEPGDPEAGAQARGAGREKQSASGQLHPSQGPSSGGRGNAGTPERGSSAAGRAQSRNSSTTGASCGASVIIVRWPPR